MPCGCDLSAHRKAASAHRGRGQRRATGGAGVEVDGTDGGGGAGRWGGGPRHHRAVHDLKGRAVGPLGRVLSRGRPNASGGWSGHEVPSRGVSTLQRNARRLAGPRWSRRRCLTLKLGRVGGGECHCACVPPVAPPRRAKRGCQGSRGQKAGWAVAAPRGISSTRSQLSFFGGLPTPLAGSLFAKEMKQLANVMGL